MTETETKVEPKPFHESIVDAIERAKRGNHVLYLGVLGALIRRTTIPHNHDAIIEAWRAAARHFDMAPGEDIISHLVAQKEAAKAIAVEKAGAEVSKEVSPATAWETH